MISGANVAALPADPVRHNTRIAIVLPDLAAIGAQRYILGVLRELDARGFHCDVLLQSATGKFLDEIPQERRRIFGYRLLGRLPLVRTLESIVRLARLLRAAPYDCVLAVTPFMNRVCCLLKRLHVIDARIVIEEHGYPPLYLTTADGLSRFEVAFYWHTFWLYRSAAAIRVISEGIQEYYRRRGLLENVRLFPNLIDLGRLRTLSAQPPDLIFPPNQFNIAYFGRLSLQKNVSFLIESFAIMASQVNCHLWIIGDGEERGALEEQVRRLGLQDLVSFLGFVDNPYSLLRNADLLALTSVWEGSPQVIVEAMALELPVVAVDCLTGPADLIGHSERGWLVPRDCSPGDFAAATLAALAARDDRRQRAERARDFVYRTYDLDGLIDSYIAAFIDEPTRAGHQEAASPRLTPIA